MADEIPILLLPGLAADDRMFAAQSAAFPNVDVLSWIEPFLGESLRAYAARLATRVDPGRPCIVGGASFGGVVALELARHLPAVACVLIGSVRSPAALPWQWRTAGSIAWLGPDVLRLLATAGCQFNDRFQAASIRRRLRRLGRPEAAFERWGMCALVRWRPGPSAEGVRVFQIHGANDRLLPIALGNPDVIVPDGGHALSLFSPAAVKEFLASVMHSVAAE